MKLDAYAAHCDLLDHNELEKVELLAFYLGQVEGANGFTIARISDLFDELLLARPNASRLRNRVRKSKNFVRASAPEEFRLSAGRRQQLQKKFPALAEPAEEAEAIDGILPIALVSGTRGYILNLSKQINVSYENSAFDGAALLMRRLIEILLIHAFDHHGNSMDIQNETGGYVNLNSIIALAVQDQNFNLSKPVKNCLDAFRKLGNFSAHSIHYNAKKSDIKAVAMEYRVAVEELLYKGGFKR